MFMGEKQLGGGGISLKIARLIRCFACLTIRRRVSTEGRMPCLETQKTV